MSSYLRPDEKASLADIERSRRQDNTLKSGLKTAANIASTVTGVGVAAKTAGPLASKIMPFINKYITPDLAVKGISKISPEIGNLLKRGMGQGLDIKDGLDFLSKQMQQNPKEEQKKEPAKENRNIIEQESPELHQFILEKIKGGENPIQAGARAFNDKRFTQAINKLKNQYKTNWSNIIETVFGKGEKALSQSQNTLAQEAMQPAGSQPTRPPSAESQAASQQSIQQQPGQGQQALMAILQKIQQSRGGK